MSILVENLVKVYGDQRAVNNISFEAKPGQVLGFLGPNGAGKTTTMKIITCFLPQTEGKVTVCGYDTITDSLDVRRQIGYLPEHNPLYKDMYVREYLQFAARTSKLTNAGQRIEDLIEMTGLGRERHKLIGALSKGYRQRVGLAQAMLHDPQVLILDEPTSGLDPNQLAEIRKLIQDLGKEKTVVFSTHIMQEVQAICDRVLIIDRGNLVADDPIERLQSRLKGEVIIKLELIGSVATKELENISGVSRAEANGQGRYRLFISGKDDPRAEIFRFVVDKGLTMLGMQREELSVEDVFRQLTAQQNVPV
ncbi:gliding motility-associated ABC transporter ATP-binding subunit GldA [Lewinellaceae bacterium SD302]|nr:gliding motility-associated ABC transporter ATP-binding subunit GldA [Lewinellaceae bacterium SD302]